jgi:hypothetical protein
MFWNWMWVLEKNSLLEYTPHSRARLREKLLNPDQRNVALNCSAVFRYGKSRINERGFCCKGIAAVIKGVISFTISGIKRMKKCARLMLTRSNYIITSIELKKYAGYISCRM